MKYEIKPNFYDGYHFESEIATLTGLDLDDILPITKDVTRWSGTTYIKVFRQLGYNCNPRFKKFKKESEYPCLMRTRKKGDKKYWYGFIYHDHKIYLPDKTLTWSEWNAEYPNYKITSMLQVWI